MKITDPGVYPDLGHRDYHAQHDWLSWSGMKKLIPPSTPAHFKAALDGPEERKRHFDLGKVVHALVLGDGEEFEVVQAQNRAREWVDAESYNLVSAQKHRDLIYDEGRVPILRSELVQAREMAAAVKANPNAAALFAAGQPEVSLFWVDPLTGVKCKARLDWLPARVEGRRMILADLKTAVSAAPAEFAKAAARYGYYGQACHYLDGVHALGLDPDPVFLFVVVETATGFVSIDQFAKPEDIKLARRVVDHCRRLYGECVAADRWPAYGDQINHLELPTWLHFDMEDALT